MFVSMNIKYDEMVYKLLKEMFITSTRFMVILPDIVQIYEIA